MGRKRDGKGFYSIKCVLLFLFCSLLTMAQDYSTPKDGNLYVGSLDGFKPNKLKVYEDNKVLQTKSLSLQNNRIHSNYLRYDGVSNENKTPNTDIAWVNNKIYVVLTGETTSYAHGILGDEIESTGFEVYSNKQLIARYRLPKGRVFETLRPTIADIIPSNKGKEIILTSSNLREGSRVEAYSLSGELLGVSKPIGNGYRWLHVLGVAPFGESVQDYLAIVKTPHIGGTLELLKWNGEYLRTEFALEGVSSHKLGSDNLNMGLLVNADGYPDAEVIVPSSDYSQLLVIKYLEQDERLEVINRIKLPSILTTNLYYEAGNSPSLWLSLLNGDLVQVYE